MSRTPNLPALAFALVAASALACSPMVDPDYSGEPLATIRGAVQAQGEASAADVAVLWFTNGDNQCQGPEGGCGQGGGGLATEEALACVDACGPEPAGCQVEGQAEYSACVGACGWDYFYALYWDLCVNSGSGERVSVTGQFPAAFNLDLFQPPPESALLVDSEGIRVAYGWFIVADPEVETITLDLNTDTPPSSIIGGTGEHALIYAADPIPADSTWGAYLGGAYEVGYHIVEPIPGINCDDWGPEDGKICVATSTTYAPAPDDLATTISVTLAPFESIEWPGLH